MKWALELEEFKVIYRPKISIKGQALANFLVEFTYPKEPEQAEPIILLPDLQNMILTWVPMLTDPQPVRAVQRELFSPSPRESN